MPTPPLTVVLISVIVLASSSFASSQESKRPIVTLEGGAALLKVDLGGGSIVDFHLRGQSLNPLTWNQASDSSAPRPMGHFLCLDRWGPPTDVESKNGMPFHGEASSVEWRILKPSAAEGQEIKCEIGAELPLAGLRVVRRLSLSRNNALVVVRDEVTNVNKLGRIYNIVQHATIAPPFLDRSTLVDSNAGRGFMQTSPLPNPENPSVTWPEALLNGKPVDLRRLAGDPNPNVVSYTVDGDIGWVTACNPSRGLLIGYVWRTAEYPWFNAWRDATNGEPAARGLEFGTTGLHQPFPTLVAKGRIFGRPLFDYIDSGQTVAKTFGCFLFKIPADYRGPANLTVNGGKLILRERPGGPERELSMDSPELFRALP